MQKLTIEDKERESEGHFKKWLDKNEVPYWYIQQDLDTFSPSLRKYMTKRPDYMILMPNIGFILTDVEYKKVNEKYGNFPVDKKETEQYLNLQKYFNLQVWYVFAHSRDKYHTWSWIPVQKIIKEGEIFSSSVDNREFFAVSAEKTIQLTTNDNLGALLSKASFLLGPD